MSTRARVIPYASWRSQFKKLKMNTFVKCIRLHKHLSPCALCRKVVRDRVDWLWFINQGARFFWVSIPFLFQPLQKKSFDAKKNYFQLRTSNYGLLSVSFFPINFRCIDSQRNGMILMHVWKFPYYLLQLSIFLLE